MHHLIVLRTGSDSGQCQVVQEKGKAELQFSVFVFTRNIETLWSFFLEVISVFFSDL